MTHTLSGSSASPSRVTLARDAYQQAVQAYLAATTPAQREARDRVTRRALLATLEARQR